MTWRTNVKVWKVEQFFGSWIVRPDQSDQWCYRSRWRWLAVREAKRLAAENGGSFRLVRGD